MAEIASAYVSILPSAQGFTKRFQSQVGTSLGGVGSKLGKDFGDGFTRDASGRLRDSKGRFVAAGTASGKGFGGGFASSLKGIVTGVLGLMAAQKVVGFFKDSIAEAREAQVVTARTENVIKSMGLSGTVTAGQIGKLAMSISNKTAVDDEAIQSGQNLLLTFGNVASSAGEANGVFAQTSQLMVDMSVAMGSDAKSAALQLGKALNDPTKGVTALARAGVSFTQQQKDQIAAMQESGDILGAQNIILGEVKKQFGGAAAAMSTPAERAKVAWANFQEQIGTLLLPVIDRLLTALSGKVIPAISTFITQVQSGSGVGGQFAAAFSAISSVLGTVFGFIASNKEAVATFAGILLTVAAAVKVWTIAQIALNIAMTANPIGLIILAIAALAAGLVYAYQKSETFRAIVDAVFSFLRTVVGATVGFIADHWQLIVSIIGGPLVAIGILVVKHWGAIKSFVTAAVSAVINFVRDHWRLIITIIGGPLGLAVALVTKHWNTIKSATTAAWNAIKSVITTQINAAKGVVATAIGAIQSNFGRIAAIVDRVRGWFSAIVEAVREKLNAAVELARGFPGRVLAAVGDLGRLLYQKGRDLIQGLIDGIRDMIPNIPNPASLIPDLPGLPRIPGLGRGVVESSGLTVSAPISPVTVAPAVGRGADPLLSRISAQLDVLNNTTARQGREFGRELNGAVSHGEKKAS